MSEGPPATDQAFWHPKKTDGCLLGKFLCFWNTYMDDDVVTPLLQDWNMGRPCRQQCKMQHWLHVCQVCSEPCDRGHGMRANVDPDASSSVSNGGRIGCAKCKEEGDVFD